MSIKLLMRKISNSLSRGKLLKLTPGTSTVAKVGLFANEVYDGLEYPQDFGFKSAPPVGAEVLAAFLAGNRDHGTILRMFMRSLIPDDLEEGETMLYNFADASVKLDKNSNIIIKTADSTVTVNNDGTVVIDALSVSITGDLVVGGTINGAPFP